MTERRIAQTWDDLRPRSLRHGLRSAAVSGLALLGHLSGRLAINLRRPRVHFLILHHVFPNEEAGFRALLTALKRDHQFISYSEAVRRICAGGTEIDRPYVTVTFDDGFKNCLRAAAILEEFGTRGMFFVCPPIIGERDPATIERFCRERLELPVPVEFMSWDDLQSLRARGHEIGGHTMSHINLARVSHDEAVHEIVECRRSIVSHVGVCDHFAWTYGRFGDFSPALVKAVFDAGFMSCASGERGCHGPQRVNPREPMIMRREHVIAAWPSSHAMYFLARSSERMSPDNGAWPAGP